jgi:cation:H+ antiporter
VLLMQAVTVILLLAIAAAGSAAGEGIELASVGSGTVILFVAYLLAVFIVERFERRSTWKAVNPPEKPAQRVGDRDHYRALTNRRIYLSFGGASLLILISGWAVTKASEAVAEQTGLSATFVGATLLAITTSLPELSTTIQAARLGAYGMAISNIFGSNAMDTALLFVADLGYREGPILREAGASATFAAALGIVLTCVYLWGLLEREDRSVGRFGWDSAAVLTLYLVGMSVLYTLDT